MANPYPYAPPPPQANERSNTVWIVLGIILIAILLCCGGCTALFGLGLLADPDDKSDGDRSASDTSTSNDSSGSTQTESEPPTTDPTTRRTSELDNDTPREVTEGKRFTHDQFEVAPGWRVADEEYFGATIEDLRVTNVGGDRRTAILIFRFYDGKTVLAEVYCDSNQMQAGETSPMDCGSLDTEFPNGYNAIKVSDAW